MSIVSDVEGRDVLKLTEWELGNLHLPPVTTVPLYEGFAPVEFLRNRIACMLETNPWLTSRIVKKFTEDGGVAMSFPKGSDAKSAAERHFSVYKPGDVGLSLSMSYEELVGCLLPLQCARSKPATDKNKALFKAALIMMKQKAIHIIHEVDNNSIVLCKTIGCRPRSFH